MVKSNLHVKLCFQQKKPFAAITADKSVAFYWSFYQFLQIFSCDLLPGLVKHFPEVCCAGWAVFLNSLFQFLPHQLDDIQIWWLSRPSHHRVFQQLLSSPNNSYTTRFDCLAAKCYLPQLWLWETGLFRMEWCPCWLMIFCTWCR